MPGITKLLTHMLLRRYRPVGFDHQTGGFRVRPDGAFGGRRVAKESFRRIATRKTPPSRPGGAAELLHKPTPPWAPCSAHPTGRGVAVSAAPMGRRRPPGGCSAAA